MEKVIELIEQRISELETQRKNDVENSKTDYQRQDHEHYYRGALNELFRLKEQLKKDYLR